MFTNNFIKEVYDLYPNFTTLHNAIKNGDAGMIGRCLADSADCADNGIDYKKILSATSLIELKNTAEIIKRKRDLYHSFMSGNVYQTSEDKKRMLGCPRVYGQNADRSDVCDAFMCYGVSYIPYCKKYGTGECWKRFDELGFTF